MSFTHAVPNHLL